MALARHPLWNSLLVHFKEHNCLVEGPLTNLKQSAIAFQQARKFYDRRLVQNQEEQAQDDYDYDRDAAAQGGQSGEQGYDQSQPQSQAHDEPVFGYNYFDSQGGGSQAVGSQFGMGGVVGRQSQGSYDTQGGYDSQASVPLSQDIMGGISQTFSQTGMGSQSQDQFSQFSQGSQGDFTY